MYCSKCGKLLNDNDKFCSSCGTEVKHEENISENDQQSSVLFPTYQPQKGSVFSIEGLLNISGRRNRKPYFWMTLGTGMLIGMCNNVTDVLKLKGFFLYIVIALWLVFVYVSAVNMAKRFQDTNHDGKIPLAFNAMIVVGSIFQIQQLTSVGIVCVTLIHLYCLFKKGTSGPNIYGADPLENE